MDDYYANLHGDNNKHLENCSIRYGYKIRNKGFYDGHNLNKNEIQEVSIRKVFT